MAEIKLQGAVRLLLTLGVAARFFDRSTDAFVLPRPSALNSRVPAVKYQLRTVLALFRGVPLGRLQCQQLLRGG